MLLESYAGTIIKCHKDAAEFMKQSREERKEPTYWSGFDWLDEQAKRIAPP